MLWRRSARCARRVAKRTRTQVRRGARTAVRSGLARKRQRARRASWSSASLQPLPAPRSRRRIGWRSSALAAQPDTLFVMSRHDRERARHSHACVCVCLSVRLCPLRARTLCCVCFRRYASEYPRGGGVKVADGALVAGSALCRVALHLATEGALASPYESCARYRVESDAPRVGAPRRSRSARRRAAACGSPSTAAAPRGRPASLPPV